jgi:hypothetical protein
VVPSARRGDAVVPAARRGDAVVLAARRGDAVVPAARRGDAVVPSARRTHKSSLEICNVIKLRSFCDLRSTTDDKFGPSESWDSQ